MPIVPYKLLKRTKDLHHFLRECEEEGAIDDRYNIRYTILRKMLRYLYEQGLYHISINKIKFNYKADYYWDDFDDYFIWVIEIKGNILSNEQTFTLTSRNRGNECDDHLLKNLKTPTLRFSHGTLKDAIKDTILTEIKNCIDLTSSNELFHIGFVIIYNCLRLIF